MLVGDAETHTQAHWNRGQNVYPALGDSREWRGLRYTREQGPFQTELPVSPAVHHAEQLDSTFPDLAVSPEVPEMCVVKSNLLMCSMLAQIEGGKKNTGHIHPTGSWTTVGPLEGEVAIVAAVPQHRDPRLSRPAEGAARGPAAWHQSTLMNRCTSHASSSSPMLLCFEND